MSVLGVHADSSTRTTRPVTTTSSVMAVKYRDGVLVASDTIVAYGNWKRFKDVDRYATVGKNTVVCMSGEHSDFQEIQQVLKELETKDALADDGYRVRPNEVAHYLNRIYYQRRSKMNPLWNSVVVAGFDGGEGYLGYTDLYGTFYEENYLATGFAAYFGMPHLRNEWRADMTLEEAQALLADCLKIVFARECTASNKIRMARVSAGGVELSGIMEVHPQWNLAHWSTRTIDLDLAASTW